MVFERSNITAQEPQLQILAESSNPPTGSLRHSLRNLLHAAQDELVNLSTDDEGCQEAQVARSEVERKRISLLSTISKLENILAPVRLLPTEVLEECFMQCVLAEPRRKTHGDGYCVLDRSWYLRQVCKEWRAIASNCPSLWTTVEIEILQHEGQDMPLVKDAFLRSNGLPLSLSVTYYRTDASFLPSLIYPELPRVEELTLRMGDNSKEVFNDHPLPFSEMRILESFRLRIKTRLGPPTLFNTLGGFVFPQRELVGLPLLTSLKTDILLDPARDCLPWKQLTHLVTFCDDIQIRPVIAICPNLVYLRASRNVSWLPTPYTYNSPDSVVTHQRLEELDITLPRTFTSTRMPGLKRLALGPGPYDGWNIDELPNQLAHLLSSGGDLVSSTSGSINLERFHFGMGGKHQSFVPLCSSLPALQSLALTVLYYDKALAELVDALVFQDGNDTFLPNLSIFEIHLNNVPPTLENFPFLNHRFIAMLQSRQDTLNSVRIDVSYWEKGLPKPAFDVKDWEGVKLLRSKGMKLFIMED